MSEDKTEEAEELTILQILSRIQFELVAPKGQKNDFGDYYYRSCEDILNALKPYLDKYECVLNITDELVLIGERYYIKATAGIERDGKIITSNGYAREPESRKGMDLSQITGSASSYARKYALAALFAIDDGIDADLTNKHDAEEIDALVEGIKDAQEKGDWAKLCTLSSDAGEDWALAWGKLDSHRKGKINKLTDKCGQYRDGLNTLSQKDDREGALQLWEELSHEEKEVVWKRLENNTKNYITEVKAA